MAPRIGRVAAAAAGGTGEREDFLESDECEEKRDEAAVAEPSSMSPTSTYSRSPSGEEACGSPYEGTKAHPKDMEDYVEEAMERLCDDEHDSMTRGSSIGNTGTSWRMTLTRNYR